MDYIRKFGEITQIDALQDLGIMRLASRISELKKNGEQIEVARRTIKNRYQENCEIAVYSLAAEVKKCG